MQTSLPQQNRTLTDRIILSLSRRTWRNLARISITFFVLTFIVLLIFYFRIYVPSIKEEYFEEKYDCIAFDIRNNSYVCQKTQKSTPCQLVITRCTNNRNLTIYSTWYDNERAGGLCTDDPCSSSSTRYYMTNQQFSPVYGASKFDYGYLERISRLSLRISKIIFYFLVFFMILTFILSICFVVILHAHRNSQKFIHPMNSLSTTASMFTRQNTIISQPTGKTMTELQMSAASSKSLIGTVEINPTISTDSSENQKQN